MENDALHIFCFNRKLAGLVIAVFLFTAALCFTGCASPAVPDEMVPEHFTVEKKQPYSVYVLTGGGAETNPLFSSEVSDEALANALAASLQKSGVFKQIIQGSNADYTLEVRIDEVNKPLAGFNMTVDITTIWKLTKNSTGKIVFQTRIDKDYTATVGDAFAGIKRLRLAEQGAVSENIREGIYRLSQLNL